MTDPRISGIRLRQWNEPEPYFKFTLSRYRRGFVGKHDPVRLEPTDRSRSVHHMAGGNSKALLAVMPEALVVGSPLGGQSRTWLALGMCPFLLICVWVSLMSFYFLTFKGGFVVGGSVFFVIGLLFFFPLIWVLKLGFFMPKDFPIVFNRKTRQVTFLPQTVPKFWKFWSTELKRGYQTQSWDEMRARSYSFVGTNAGRSFYESCKLMMLWGGLDGDPAALRETVEVGFKDQYQDELLWMLWEHIRRYMEEGGPAIRRDDSLRKLGPGKAIVYPPEVVKAAGGPPLSAAEVERIASTAPGPED